MTLKTNFKNFVSSSLIIFLLIFLSLLFCVERRPHINSHYFPQHVTLTGELRRRIALTQKRLQADHPYQIDFTVQDVARIKGKERRFEEYEGDISGRVLSAWSYSARLFNQRPAKLDSIAHCILEYQNVDGSFGKDQQPLGWDYWGRQLWGHGRLLVGLVEYFKLTHDVDYKNSAEKLADYLIKGIPSWAVENQSHHWFTNYTSLLESLMLLYEISPHEKILDAAKKIGLLIPEFGVYHSHGYLISLVGLAKLHQVTGEKSYLKFLHETYWHHLFPRARQIDGSVSEWFPVGLRTEGCAIVDWLRLNLLMWEISKEGIYLDEAERTWLNALNFHQTGNGAFGHATRDPRDYYSDYHESWWCCLEHGLFGLTEIANYSVVRQQKDLWINFYHSLKAALEQSASSASLILKTDYPGAGDVFIKINPITAEDFTVYLRLPLWAKNHSIKINDEPINCLIKNGFAAISRSWQPGDEIKLTFPLALRLEDSRGNIIEKRFAPHSPIVPDGCFYFGPLLLGVDLKNNNHLPQKIKFAQGKNYESCIMPNVALNNKFAIAAAHFQLSEIFGDQETISYLTPLSEQTGYTPWTAELQNFVPNGEMGIDRYPVRMMFEVELND